MSTAAVDTLPTSDATTFGGHPRGLRTLFFTEMWERFSFYGMRALLFLYMVAPESAGGLGFPIERAGAVYGWYTSLVYFAALPGGLLADRLLGQRTAVLIGGIVIAVGHFCLASSALPLFYGGLVLIIAGTGLLKPNISTMVGGLYPPGDHRRDGGFSIFYMGINLGGFISPLVCGYLAQDKGFIARITAWGFHPEQSWHFGFAAAGLGMTWGVAQFLLGRRHLAHVGNAPGAGSAGVGPRVDLAGGFTGEELKRIFAIGLLFVFSSFFWSASEQAGSSLNLFADQMTDNSVFGYAFPSSWLQSVNSLFIIALAPVFALLWIRLGDREPSSPAKFGWGLFFVGLSFVAVAGGAYLVQQSGGKASPWWLIASYLLSTLGELSLSPVGLSTVTKLAPPRIASLSMGVWFTSIAVGDKVGGWVAGHFDPKGSVSGLFLLVALFAFIATGVLAALTPWIKRLMSGVK